MPSAASARPLDVPATRTRGASPHDTYLFALCWVLAGYAVLGRGFAAIGLPPLYIGELSLLAGVVVLLRTRCWLALPATPACLILLVLMVWVVLRTVPYVGPYGIDALRDSVVILYGLFALVVIALVVEDPRRLAWIVSLYARFAWLYGIIGGALFIGSVFLAERLPQAPIQLPYVRPGEAATHLAGAAVFVLLGLRRVTLVWCVLLVVSMVLVSASRAAMLACLIPVVLAIVLGGHLRRVLPVLIVGAVMLGLGAAVDLQIPLPGGRDIGTAQILNGLASVFGTNEASNFEGTKEFRLRWWAIIQDYTLRGPYFWTGKGFGVNLALEDGYAQWVTQDSVLRSPHNGHMTILARAGVPGLALWIGLLAAWFAMLLRSHLLARQAGDATWAAVFLWIACYGTAVLVNASFDVALEGPMSGIWFWSLFGLGVGASMTYRADLRSLLDDAR